MASEVNIGNNSILIIRIPARGATDWAAEFKANFADRIADHDHTTGQGARIKNAALVTNAMVAAGEGVTDTNNDFTAYTSADVAVSTDTIQDLAVTTAKIANDAVDGTKIADNSITADHIVDGTIIAADVANDAITTDKILDANVTTAKIADGAVTLDKLSNTIIITQNTTITGNVENTHYIIDSSTAVTLTFNGSAQVVDSCKFSANVSPAIHKIELHGDITFQNNDMDGYASLYLNLQNIDLDAFIIKNNNIKTVRVQADFEGLDTGISGDTGAANFLHNIMTIRSQGSVQWRMPLGSFSWNKITFIDDATFYTYVTDNVSAIKHSNIPSNQTSVIEFLDGYDSSTSTYGTVDNPTTNSTLTISDTKPFAVYGNEKKGVLTPELSDLSDVSSTAPSTGQVLKWDGSEWAPGTDQAGSGGGSITTIATQTDANSYSPSEGDTLKITADVTFTDVTFSKIDIYVDDNTTLTFNSSDISDCKIVGGNLLFKGTSTGTDTTSDPSTLSIADTFSIKRSQIFCNECFIIQDLASPQYRITTTLTDVFIKCGEFKYNLTNSMRIDVIENGDDRDISTSSTWTRVTLMNKSWTTANQSSFNEANAVANLNDCTFLNYWNTSFITNRQLNSDSSASPGSADIETCTRSNTDIITTTSL